MAARWRVEFRREGWFWVVEASTIAVAVKRALDRHARQRKRLGIRAPDEVSLTARRATPAEVAEWDAHVARERAAREAAV